MKQIIRNPALIFVIVLIFVFIFRGCVLILSASFKSASSMQKITCAEIGRVKSETGTERGCDATTDNLR